MTEIISEILSNVILANNSGKMAFYTLLGNILQTPNPANSKPVLALKTDRHPLSLQNNFSNPDQNPFDACENGSILIIPVIGPMTKYGSWFHVGIDTIADIIETAERSERIDGFVLDINTPGGTVQSLFKIESVIKNLKKPIVAQIDGMGHSAGMYLASLCKKIYATSRICECGSIGAMCTILIDQKYLENLGIEIKEIYAPESSYKNKPTREAIAGNDELIKTEALSPIARHFQEIIRKNRKRLDTSVEGILEGREFYAYDAVQNGLIDGIQDIGATIEAIKNRVKSIKDIQNSIF